MHPKITVIITSFGTNDLNKCIQSVINQNLYDIEIFYISYIDENLELLEKYSKLDSRIHILNSNIKDYFQQLNSVIDNINSDYLMFLNQCDVLLENACSTLYEEIHNNHLDIVFTNSYMNDNNFLMNLNNTELKISSIKEEPKLLSLSLLLNNKIFKKELITKNNIRFSNEYDEGLLFVCECFSKANGIKFINKHITKYDESQCNLSKINKKQLSDFILSYKKLCILSIDNDFIKYSITNFNYWIKLFILSKVDLQDKINLLMFAKPIFDYFKRYNLNEEFILRELFYLVYKKKYFEAVLLSKQLVLEFDLDYYNFSDDIRERNIVMVSTDWSVENGGLPKAVCDRANLFDDNGYSVSIINIDDLKDVQIINDTFHKLGFLNESLNIINIFEYYSEKNTLNFNIPIPKLPENMDSNDYFIRKSINNYNVTVLTYYDCSKEKDCCQNNMVKEESYVYGYLSLIKYFDKGILKYKKYYTRDGFNYFLINYITNDFMLFDRLTGCYITFDNIFEFRDYFIREFCLKSKKKPFLINDSSWNQPSIKNINSDIAYKLGVVHGNPYVKPYCYGSSMNFISSLHEFNNLDASVVLTESAKFDCMREFNKNKFEVIPNFINENLFEITKKSFIKENNVISVFSRVAYQKNLSDLIKAFKIVLDKHDDAILKIFGRVESFDEIQEKKILDELILELGISNSVKFMGHVNNTFEEMNKSLVTLFVSHFEGLPLSLIESMICSTPVISYDTSYGPKDVIVNGVNGIIVNQYDVESLAKAIIDLLDCPEKAHEMGKLARQHIINNFSSEIALNKWESLFKKIHYKNMLYKNNFNECNE